MFIQHLPIKKTWLVLKVIKSVEKSVEKNLYKIQYNRQVFNKSTLLIYDDFLLYI